MILKWRNHLVKVDRFEVSDGVLKIYDGQAIDLNDRATNFPFLILRKGEFQVLKASSSEKKRLRELKDIAIAEERKRKTIKSRDKITWIIKLKPDEFCKVGEIKGFKAYYSYLTESTSPLGLFRRIVSTSREARVISFNLEKWILKCVSPKPPSKVVAEIQLPDGETWRHQITIKEVKPSWLE